ncbi:uncharacterized protein LOC142521049 [Primulina tabacum]|uniref:uncharacterized protein LOC142521049 n=1 Tax=Primulina tabacum TaxID=48773 RepID=UPI003F59BBE5
MEQAQQAQQAPRPQTDFFEQFIRLNQKEFEGTTDPFLAEGWIRSLELHYEYLQMREEDRVRCAIYMLRDDASLWWEGAVHAVDLATLTWDRFMEILYDKYFPADVKSRLTKEFMSLRQGDSTVAEFIRDVAQKLRHFMDDLRPTLRRDVMLMRPASYEKATDYAFQAEQALMDIDFEMQRKRHQTQTSSQPQKKQFTGPPRQEGHKAADCPRNTGPTTGQSYVMHSEEAEAEPDSMLITGRIYISDVATHALLDSRATHSFIFESFIKRLGIIPVAMDAGFRVSISSRDQMFTSQIVKRLELRLQKYTVQDDLVVLPLPEFNIILGMDLLFLNGAIIDFGQRKLMKSGCRAFLASIVSVSEPVSQRLEGVDVVREFSSVFPDDASGIPLDREVDFSIELMPGTVPFSKASYCLAPAEMKKLKDLIQDLLDKGFIRPNVSP